LDRVNGELAMSRALGDYQYKLNKHKPSTEQMVIAYPDVAVHVRDRVTDGLLILACDGVWDVVENTDATGFLLEVVLPSERDATARQLADALVDVALTNGSTDNISAIVVKLQGKSNAPLLGAQGGAKEGEVAVEEEEKEEETENDDVQAHKQRSNKTANTATSGDKNKDKGSNKLPAATATATKAATATTPKSSKKMDSSTLKTGLVATEDKNSALINTSSKTGGEKKRKL
jgi:hypothetical protein